MDDMELAAQEAVAPVEPEIGKEQIQKFLQILEGYRTGKDRTDKRIIASENWWKLRNTQEEVKETEIGEDGGFTSRSAWLHNVIVSKHADAMDAYPSPVFLPREESDKQAAQMLSAIVPCVMEHNDFERTYSDGCWDKMKSGTAVYKVIWDKNALNGLGDIALETVNVLHLFWQPGITDIQKSRYVFQVEMVEKDILVQKYPELDGKLVGKNILTSEFLYDDAISKADYAPVVEVYYHQHQKGRKVLHYCKFVGDTVLYATENEPAMVERGLYDHGKYPYVFDVLFPIEGSPCGYGYVDLCKSPQTEIDLMKTAFLKNAMVGAIPRYFHNQEGAVKAKDFLDLSKPLIPVNGSLDDMSLRPVQHTSLEGNYLNLLQHDIQELRETSGNTETATGTTNSGVTAASAIAALQQASGKGSRDSTKASYRAYTDIVELVVEMIRQFYDVPRQFRITGESGMEEFVLYSNAQLKPQPQQLLGMDMGTRMPVFDIEVKAQKADMYTTVAQNEMAIQFFQMGFFNPQLADQALLCIGMMDFQGKNELVQKIQNNAMLWQKLQQYMQLALQMAQQADPMLADAIAQDIMQVLGQGAIPAMGGGMAAMQAQPQEDRRVSNARAQSAQAAQPNR